jgi:hypothetical protein
MNILENIKPCGEIPIWQKTLITSKRKQKLKRFELFPQVALKKNYTIFFFLREKKTKNPLKYMLPKPYKKNPNY